MKKLEGKTALVTGASSGIGESTVRQLLTAGATVYAAARRVEKMKSLEREGARIMTLDITQEESILKAVETIQSESGRLDILINNAGYGSYGALEDVPMDEARRQFEVNIFGLARLTQLTIPLMREKAFGRIVNISSIGGKMCTPFGGWYHATKHALEGLSDSLRLEVRPFGIDVVVVEPGGIATPWGIIAADNLRKTSLGSAYEEKAGRVADSMTKMYQSSQLSSPELIGRVIIKSVTSRRPKTRYAAGYMSGFSLFMRRILSDRAFDRIIQSAI